MLSFPIIVAMHIDDAQLPPQWSLPWYLVAGPFLWWGLRGIKKRAAHDPRWLAMVSLVGAAVFVISSVHIPLPWGTSEHACGTGLAAILIGVGPTIVVTSIALVLQAIFLHHGGIVAIGADLTSLGVAGALVACGVFRGCKRVGMPAAAAAFAAGVLSNWAVYAVASLQLGLAAAGDGSAGAMILGMAMLFAPVQLPLGIIEGALTAGAYRFLLARRPEALAARG